MASLDRFRAGDLSSRPIRDLGLTIEGTPLEPVVAAFQQELERLGILRLRPDFYLSTDWGVNFGTLAIGIPFYLARPELTAMHAERIGYLEGGKRSELLRFLRHEMGHVVNYAYKLYEQAEWTKLFGSIALPYEEDYRSEPFSRRFVHHLPGWYAQMHPDEDWAETFAVWMTPGYDWRAAYADSPDALAKLEYCDRTMCDLNTRDPDVTATERDEDVSELTTSLEQIYLSEDADVAERFPLGLDWALQAIFEDIGSTDEVLSIPRLPAAELIRRVEQDLMASVYRWTGHFPERTRSLLRYLAARAEQLQQVYPADQESTALIALATLVTSLAMNHALRGSYYI